MIERKKKRERKIKALQARRARIKQLEKQLAEYQETKEKLQASEQRIRSILQVISDIIIETDAEGRYLAVHTAADELLFKLREELIGKKIEEILPLEVTDHFLRGIHQAVMTGRPQTVEYELQVPAGKRYFEARIVAHGDQRVLSFIRDISDSKRAEEALQLTQFVMDQAPESIIWVDSEGNIVYANEITSLDTGYTHKELLQIKIFDLDPAFSPRGWKLAKKELQKVGKMTFETIHHRKDGRSFPVEVTANYLENKGIFFGIAFIRNISERKRTEQALRLTQFSVEKATESVFWIGPDAKIRYANEQVCRHLGYSRDELLGMRVFDFDPDFSPEIWPEHWSELRTKGSMLIESRHRRKDGTIVPVEININYIQFEGEECNFAFARDISERKKAEEEKDKLQAQLTQAQKMESVGRLAGGIAHDFNNMLGVILGRAELALLKLGPNEPLHAELTEIQKASRHSADLTRQLLAFARQQTITPKVLDLNETVQGMLTMLKRLIGEDIDLVWKPGKALWPVNIDPAQVDQILANLCVNARDAITGPGKITIETDQAVFDEDYCARHIGFMPGDYMLLAVSDDGCGMDEQVFSHLFEPFFTTKEIGKGSGLGLASVYGSVQQNNGFIKVYSEPGQGSTFKIYLPRHTDKAAQKTEKRRARTAERGRETILLVEDEPMILEMTTTMLEMLGYSVLAARTPGEAIRLAREHSGRIDLLITDVVMPEMNGRNLARNLVSIYPEIRRLFMSGYTADVIAHHGVLDPGVHFIQKPFSMNDLGAKIREALEE